MLAALSAMAIAASCSKEAAPRYLTDPDAVRVEALVGAAARSNPVGGNETSFNDGDEIAVSNGGGYVTYTLSGGSWTPKDPSRYLRWDTDEMTFRAYYPAVDNSYDKGVLYSGQDDEGTLRKSDYMTAEARMNRRSESGNVLTLEMSRRAARVAVKVSGYRDEFDGGNPAVTGVRVYSYLTVPAEGSPEAVAAYRRTEEEGKDVFYALVCPGAARQDDTFLELTVEYGDPSQSKTLTVTGVPAMEAGKSYTYSVTVGKTTAKVGSVSVSGWTGGAAIEDGLTDVVRGWSGKAEPFAETDASGKTLGDAEASPILIESAEQLAWLSQKVNEGTNYAGKYFKLADDIDIINLANKPWTPIGNSSKSFSGHFDGNGKRIYGLNVSSAGYAGLFGRGEGINGRNLGSISNVRIESASIACTRNYAAVLCGYAEGMTIKDCFVRGTVKSTWANVGGLVGNIKSVTMTDCTAEVGVNGTFYVGGLCGCMDSGSISGCSVVNSSVEGIENSSGGAGGLVGKIDISDNVAITKCSVTGCVIKGVKFVGGLVGDTKDITSSRVSISISGCTATADLTVTGSYCGGIVGHPCGKYEIKFSDCGFDGTIIKEGTNVKYVGAAVGFDESSASSFAGCWYNADKTGGLEAVGNKAEGKDYSGITAKRLGK